MRQKNNSLNNRTILYDFLQIYSQFYKNRKSPLKIYIKSSKKQEKIIINFFKKKYSISKRQTKKKIGELKKKTPDMNFLNLQISFSTTLKELGYIKILDCLIWGFIFTENDIEIMINIILNYKPK